MDAKTSTGDGLFDGVERVINQYLGVANYKTRTAALQIAQRRGDAFDGERLVQSLFDRLSQNWGNLIAHAVKRPSAENFRWFHPQKQIGIGNRSPEVTLERALISSCIAIGRTDWSNQVPLISGLAGGSAYKRWAIDLVHQRENGFEFIELKIASDTPLSASMQILQYGMLWLLSRNDRERLGYRCNPILEARDLHLSTLAPREFYERYPNAALVNAVRSGLAVLGRKHSVALDFSQMAFPASFQWPSPLAGHELLAALEAREVI